MLWKKISYDRAPYFRHLWEFIKLTEIHLKRVSRDAILTYEELYTVLVQLGTEAVLNSCPLRLLSLDLEFL